MNIQEGLLIDAPDFLALLSVNPRSLFGNPFFIASGLLPSASHP